jgi:DNA-binding GntR family transcriptional regulator
LRGLNRELEKSRDANATIALDDEWHRRLIAGCPNTVLLELIEQMSRRTRRYEIALMTARKSALTTAIGHNAIMTALKRRDLDGACAALRRNLETGREPIIAWLNEQKG